MVNWQLLIRLSIQQRNTVVLTDSFEEIVDEPNTTRITTDPQTTVSWIIEVLLYYWKKTLSLTWRLSHGVHDRSKRTADRRTPVHRMVHRTALRWATVHDSPAGVADHGTPLGAQRTAHARPTVHWPAVHRTHRAAHRSSAVHRTTSHLTCAWWQMHHVGAARHMPRAQVVHGDHLLLRWHVVERVGGYYCISVTCKNVLIKLCRMVVLTEPQLTSA